MPDSTPDTRPRTVNPEIAGDVAPSYEQYSATDSIPRCGGTQNAPGAVLAPCPDGRPGCAVAHWRPCPGCADCAPGTSTGVAGARPTEVDARTFLLNSIVDARWKRSEVEYVMACVRDFEAAIRAESAEALREARALRDEAIRVAHESNLARDAAHHGWQAAGESVERLLPIANRAEAAETRLVAVEADLAHWHQGAIQADASSQDVRGALLQAEAERDSLRDENERLRAEMRFVADEVLYGVEGESRQSIRDMALTARIRLRAAASPVPAPPPRAVPDTAALLDRITASSRSAAPRPVPAAVTATGEIVTPQQALAKVADLARLIRESDPDALPPAAPGDGAPPPRSHIPYQDGVWLDWRPVTELTDEELREQSQASLDFSRRALRNGQHSDEHTLRVVGRGFEIGREQMKRATPAPPDVLLCVVHVPDQGRCLHDADDHAAEYCSVCEDAHPFTPAPLLTDDMLWRAADARGEA